jgi:hypothetical protein
MIAKKQLNHTGLPKFFLIPAAAFALIMIISGVPQSQAVEGTSTQTSCIDDQPCHTVICSEDQPCNVSQTPNTDFDFDADEASVQPLESEPIIAQPLIDAAPIEMVPFFSPDNSGYLEEQEDNLEDRQDMMEDAEYE